MNPFVSTMVYMSLRTSLRACGTQNMGQRPKGKSLGLWCIDWGSSSAYEGVQVVTGVTLSVHGPRRVIAGPKPEN